VSAAYSTGAARKPGSTAGASRSLTPAANSGAHRPWSVPATASRADGRRDAGQDQGVHALRWRALLAAMTTPARLALEVFELLTARDVPPGKHKVAFLLRFDFLRQHGHDDGSQCRSAAA